MACFWNFRRVRREGWLNETRPSKYSGECLQLELIFDGLLADALTCISVVTKDKLPCATDNVALQVRMFPVGHDDAAGERVQAG